MTDRGPGPLATGAKQQRRAECERDDPHVLDRVVGEQPLEVVLDERIQDADDRTRRTDDDDRDAPRYRSRRCELKRDQNQSVDRNFEHRSGK